MESANNARQIGARFEEGKPGLGKEALHIVFLTLPDFEDHRAVGPYDASSIRSQRTIGIEPVLAAIERGHRIMETNLRRQPIDIAMPDIGWIGDHAIERAADACEPM